MSPPPAQPNGNLSNGELNQPIDAVDATQRRYRRVCAFVDATPRAPTVIQHGITIANALNAELSLVHMLEAGPTGGPPADPVEWNLRRREAHAHVEKLAQEGGKRTTAIQTQVVEGLAANQVCTWTQDHHIDLTVLSTHGPNDAAEWDIGQTARQIIDHAPGSILLVPASIEDGCEVHYQRLLVPLDGSSRAESALPMAVRVAQAEHAELLLVHAVPEPELTAIGPVELEDVELRARLMHRNEQVAKDYLDQICARIADKGVSVRTMMLRGGDARRLLFRAIDDKAADLVVLASHGRSGHVDVAIGSVAAYLIAHAHVPLLIIRSYPIERGHSPSHRAHIRLPSRADA